MQPATLRIPLAGSVDRVPELPGLSGVTATVQDGHLSVAFDPQHHRGAEVVAAFQSAGVPLSVRTHRLVVTDMHCATCAGAVERGLRRLRGVVAAELTFATEKCEVIYEPDVVELRTIKRRIADLGFGALEENEATAREEAHVRDLRLQFRRLMVAWVFGLPMFVIMVLDWVGLTLPYWRHVLMFALTAPLVAVAGSVYYRSAYQALRYGRTATTDVLISLGFSASFLYSVAGLFTGQPKYFDTAAMVITFVTTGKYLKVRATASSSQAVRRLVGLQARTARRWRDGTEEEVLIDTIQPGDHVVVRAGERIPVDGTVVEGRTVVDESMLTGESFPVTKEAGSSVLAGTVNRTQPFRLEVDRVGRETALAQIIWLLGETQAGKPRMLDLSDRISAVFVPFVLGFSALTFLILALPLHAGVGAALARSVAVLVIACPCAVSLAPGTAIAVATGRAARRGMLIKGAAVLERLQRTTVVVFDKTGTLTTGRPTVSRIEAISPWDELTLLGLASAAEQQSEHPLGDAIRRAAADRAAPQSSEITTTEVIPGLGVRASVGGHQVGVGSHRFIEAETGTRVNRPHAKGGEIAVAVAVDGGFGGWLTLSDPVRAEARTVVAALRTAGRRVVMLTGDHQATAEAVAADLGVDEVFAEVLPEDKVATVRRLQGEGGLVAMVGDGLNDAAALAQADVGIALGAGADVAAEASDLTLVHPDLRAVLDALTLSRRTYRVIIQNFVYAFLFNAAGLPLAAAGFLNPVLAALSMGVSSVAVVTNSMRLRLSTDRPGMRATDAQAGDAWVEAQAHPLQSRAM